MKYLGSKDRLAKHILPIMLKDADENGIKFWIEHFVGGANIIDKVPEHFLRYGTDTCKDTIEALFAIKCHVDELPDAVSEEEYKAIIGTTPSPVSSWVRFVCSFGGKLDNGYARGKSSKGVPRNYALESKRNAIKQSPKLQGVFLSAADYTVWTGQRGVLIYCDPPYADTTGYKTGKFDTIAFWEWAIEMAKFNLVYVSEYSVPEIFENYVDVVWSGEIKTSFDSGRKVAKTATEKLYKIKYN